MAFKIDSTAVIGAPYPGYSLLDDVNGIEIKAIETGGAYGIAIRNDNNDSWAGYNSQGTVCLASTQYTLEAATSAVQQCIVIGNCARVMTAGTDNIIIGDFAMYSTTVAGDNNVIIGWNSCRMGNITGENNTCIGPNTGYYSEGAMSNCTYIGNQAGYDNDTANRVYVGNTAITYACCYSEWSNASDIRDKADVTPMTHGLDLINNLNPINYSWDKRSSYWTETAGEEGEIIIDKSPVPDGSKKEENIEVGFSAQAVKAALEAINYDNSSVVDSEDPEELTLAITGIIPFLVNSIKELSDKNDALEASINALEVE